VPDRLVALGASVERTLTELSGGPLGEFAIMIRDSEGNAFCLQ
jgi:hypothetical protein